MKYSFVADVKDGYLHVRIKGDNTVATVKRYLKDVLTACSNEGCPNVLIEEDLTGPRMAIADIFGIINERAAEFRPAMRLIAFVDVQAESPGAMKFAENVAVNRGVTVSVFRTVADAEKWIEKKLAKK